MAKYPDIHQINFKLIVFEWAIARLSQSSGVSPVDGGKRFETLCIVDSTVGNIRTLTSRKTTSWNS